jgi:hypothetical protein
MENRCVVEVIFLTRERYEVSSGRHKHGLPYGENKLYRRDSRPGSSYRVESDVKLRCSGGVLSSIQC